MRRCQPGALTKNLLPQRAHGKEGQRSDTTGQDLMNCWMLMLKPLPIAKLQPLVHPSSQRSSLCAPQQQHFPLTSPTELCKPSIQASACHSAAPAHGTNPCMNM